MRLGKMKLSKRVDFSLRQDVVKDAVDDDTTLCSDASSSSGGRGECQNSKDQEQPPICALKRFQNWAHSSSWSKNNSSYSSMEMSDSEGHSEESLFELESELFEKMALEDSNQGLDACDESGSLCFSADDDEEYWSCLVSCDHSNSSLPPVPRSPPKARSVSVTKKTTTRCSTKWVSATGMSNPYLELNVSHAT